MTARKFRADVATAAAEAAAGRIQNITSVNKGDDGEVIVTYVNDQLGLHLQVRILATDVDDYPGPCGFLFFTESDDAPQLILQSLQEVQDHAAAANNLTVLQATSMLARTLSKRLDDTEMTDADAEEDGESQADDELDELDGFNSNDAEDDQDDQDGDDLDHLYALMDGKPAAALQRPTILSESEKKVQERIRRSVRKVAAAGCRVGILSGMGPQAKASIISVSIRVRKLGISDEALAAWDLSNSDYLVLLVQINGSYPFLETVMERPAASTEMRFRIGKCPRYKPTLTQAINAFEERAAFDTDGDETGAQPVDRLFSRIFLSRSLDLFMSQYFVSLLKIRGEWDGAMSWDEANLRLLERIGTTDGSAGPAPKRQRRSSGKTKRETFDHLADDDDEDKSILLISWQFAMRYFVNCTKYCLRCHRVVETGVGSLKPFVCGNSLCLFQYMQMGLGPSVEHEIMFQPIVVDLLVSFCYVSAQPTGRYAPPNQQNVQKYAIREFPVGLAMSVPDLFHHPWSVRPPSCIPVRIDRDNSVATLFEPGDWTDELKPGKWFVLLTEQHLRDGGAALGPATSSRLGGYTLPVWNPAAAGSANSIPLRDTPSGLAFGIVISVDRSASTVTFLLAGQANLPMTLEGSQAAMQCGIDGTGRMHGDAYMALYEIDFDTLEVGGKARAMRFILDTLPPIQTIKAYLEKHPNCTVRSMPNVPPVATMLLEWIVATNRSVILQIEEPEESEPEAASGLLPQQALATVTKPQRQSRQPRAPRTASVIGEQSQRPRTEKVPDMEAYVQFRFAQGSPDKEERFNAELELAMRQEKLKHPTIFAWHGSALANWHSIIRTGLDYNEVVNGRAYGNGIYFSQDFTTSAGYLHGVGVYWPSSQLKVMSAIALSEVINIPHRFTSRSPHLVVQNTDWQQCRYLFVSKQVTAGSYGVPSSSAPSPSPSSLFPARFVAQDPSMTVRGPTGRPLRIPLAAIPSSRTINQGQWREATPAAQADEDTDEEDPADTEFLADPDDQAQREVIVISSDDDDGSSVQEISPPPQRSAHLTDFQPGALDLNTLPRLQPPQSAGSATKHLARQIASLRETQASTPAHELGWYIDFDNMENMFQIVVELHSFDQGTPLGQDMVKAGVTSVVLEMRFGESFPFSPPFVRVIRPRFLPFLNGGGGHVTAGGAMCMELLTSNGWSAACSLESVLVQVRLAITSTDPAPARLQQTGRSAFGSIGDYGIGEAIAAYRRSAQVHGWRIPEDLDQTANPSNAPLY